jgi:transposase-like protein
MSVRRGRNPVDIDIGGLGDDLQRYKCMKCEKTISHVGSII